MWVAALFLLFILVPLAELTILLIIAQASGLWWISLLLVVATGVLGASLARWQGRGVWYRFLEALRAGRLPTDEMIEGGLVLFAAGLLLTPGVLTDMAGLSLLIPWTRRIYRERLKRAMAKRFKVTVAGGDSFRAFDRGRVFEGEAKRWDGDELGG